MINWLIVANGFIIGMTFANHILIQKKLSQLKDKLDELYFKQLINDFPAKSAYDSDSLK